MKKQIRALYNTINPFRTWGRIAVVVGLAIGYGIASFTEEPAADTTSQLKSTETPTREKNYNACDFPDYDNCTLNIAPGLTTQFNKFETYLKARDFVHISHDYQINGHSVPVSDEVNQAIGLLSTITPIQNPDFWRSIAFAESRFDPDAVSESDAAGLFQIKVGNVGELLYKIKQNGRFLNYIPEAQYVERAYDNNSNAYYDIDGLAGADLKALSRQLLHDPLANGLLAFTYWQNYANLEEGQSYDVLDIYLNHFFGNTGATNFMKFVDNHPDTPAYAHFGKTSSTVQNNLGVFYDRKTDSWRSGSEVLAHLRDKRGLDATVDLASWGDVPDVRLTGLFYRLAHPGSKPEVPESYIAQNGDSTLQGIPSKPRDIPVPIQQRRDRQPG